jgi:hypothetical protein
MNISYAILFDIYKKNIYMVYIKLNRELISKWRLLYVIIKKNLVFLVCVCVRIKFCYLNE